MHGAGRAKPSSLIGLKWKFLADESSVPTAAPAPWTEEARRRIGDLEHALATSHEQHGEAVSLLGLESEGTDVPWGSMRKGALQSLVHPLEMRSGPDAAGPSDDMIAAAADDIIPSDPMDAQPAVFGGSPPPMPGRRAPPSVGMALGGIGGDDGADRPGHTDAADEEVARVQLGAAAGGADMARDADGDEITRNSPSPVIIWRHAAPVKLASNVPAELLPPAQQDESRPQRRPRVDSTKDEWGSSTRDRNSAFAKRVGYGAWYLPVDQWNDANKAGGADPAAGAANRSPKKGASARAAGAEAEVGEEAEGSSQVISKLYSSRMYKEYLKEKRCHRIPHYLARVESPKTIPSRRAAAESGTDGPAADPSHA